jgi:ABC-type Zn uptake system ZnuABC Zn-binding protein ZnuA
MTKKPLKTLASIFALVSLVSCSNSAETVSESTQTNVAPAVELPVVVVTYSVLGDIVSQLVGDKAVVNVVIPDGQDPHEFQPSAKDVETLNNAKIVVSNGLDFEEGLEDVLANAVDSGNRVFMVGDHITVLKTEDDHDHDHDHDGDEEKEESEEEHSHGGIDPHLWLSPATILEMLPALTTALSEALGVDLTSSSAALSTDLKELDAEIEQNISNLGKCDLVSGHDEMGYFATRYGCEVVGAIIPSFTTTSEATAGELADLKELVAKYKVPAIFTGLGTDPEVAEQLAKELGVKAVTLSTHYLDGATNYQEFMRKMVSQITEALK